MSKKAIVLCLLLTSVTTHARDADPKECASFLKRITARIFVRDAKKNEIRPETDVSGFLFKTDPKDLNIRGNPFKAVKAVTQALPRFLSEKSLGAKHDLRILEGLNVRYGDRTEARGKRKRLTLFSLFLTGSLLNLPLAPYEWGAMQWTAHKLAQGYVIGKIAWEWAAWGEKLRYDYRDSHFMVALQNGKINELEAREGAYVYSSDYQNFYKYLKHPAKTFKQKKIDYENSDLFGHIKALKVVVLGGAPTYLSHRPDREMSDEEEAAVFKLDEDLYINYELVSTWINAGAPMDISAFSPSLRSKLSKIIEDPFVKKLYARRNQMKIMDLEMQYLIQEDLSDKHLHAINALLQIEPLEPIDPVDQVENETLTSIDTGQLHL